MLREEQRPATDDERVVLSRWRAWGALPGVFEADTAGARELRELLTEREWAAARRTKINAHYTDPAIAAVIWRTVQELGFSEGLVLEPGCGSGLFIAAAPDLPGMHVTGIELDPVSAQIAELLHPRHTIRAESFAATTFPDDTFDLTIGNVPFADVRLYDPAHNSGHHSMHNHFIVKSLSLTRPGGLVAVLTSRYTLDAGDPSARREMYAVADLVGAIRLPSGAHRRFAGTETITDLVVLRKRSAGERPGGDEWPSAVCAPGLRDNRVNRYWIEHPEAVLGSMQLGLGRYGSDQLLVLGDTDVLPALARQSRALVTDAIGHRLTMTARETPATAPRAAPPVARMGDARRFEGHLSLSDDGQWQAYRGGVHEALGVPATATDELRALVGLRDAVLEVLALEAASEHDTTSLAAARHTLATRYEKYRARYGPINRVAVTTTSRRDKSGDPIVTRRYPTAVRVFRADPHSPTVRALERYDEASGEATAAAILSRRVLFPAPVRDRAETPADALAICLDSTGRVDLTAIATLLDTSVEEARSRLSTLVFDDPVDGRIVPAAEYLSGNVRKALHAATAAAATDPRYEPNVTALRRVLPEDLLPEEISANLGAIWIPARDVQAFLRATLGDATDVEHLGGANWKVRGGDRWSAASTATWGTDRMNAQDITERLMCQKRIAVLDEIEDGRLILNPVATEAAREKAAALQDRFAEWVWQDPDRADRLARIYNETFNAIVLRSYDAEGDRLTLPGLAADFAPHPHQRAAVARMIGEPSVGLFHAVGAGKTAEMVMGTTELRRLGLVSKPAVVVPNHMLEQVTREWLQLYPAANVLAASSEDLRGDARRDFIARVATGDWDAVILTQSAFGSIPVSGEGQRDYLDTHLAVVRDQLDRARSAAVSGASLKSMEKSILRQEQRMEALLDHKVDPGLTWEHTGIDYLVVDELHMYKNLPIVSNIRDVARDGSQRAVDLDMKITLLREKAGPHGRVITGATATPIANTMAEAWVMQRYLRPDLLHEAGLTDFDSWAATFGRTVTKIEMSPAGDGFRTKDRFAAFTNLPELLQLWHVPADVKTTRDLNLPTPVLAVNPAGQRAATTVVVPLSDAQAEFMASLASRAEQVRSRAVTPDEDSMLKISGDGRKAGLDLRLLHDTPSTVGELTKVDVAAARIHQIWQEHRDHRYPDSNRPGALQIVFADLGTPHDNQWNVYDGLRDALVDHGLDPARIRFIHDAKNDQHKASLFAQCRNGDVDVIIGSTAKMGVGTNIQARAVALHHLDCPWRPADVEQREGRILRQGNHNPEVQILRYVTEGSFDAYMWQGVARKAGFIDQVMHGKLDQRTAEDLDGQGEQFDYAVVSAVASGTPLLLEKANAQADVDKLERLAAAHTRNQGQRALMIRTLTGRLEHLRTLETALETAGAKVRSTTGDAFTAQIAGHTYAERPGAAVALRAALHAAGRDLGRGRTAVTLDNLVDLGGNTFTATIAPGSGGPQVTLAMRGLEAQIQLTTPLNDLGEAGHGIITRLENLAASPGTLLDRTRIDMKRTANDIDEARSGLGAPLPRAAELATARARLHELDSALNPQSQTDPEAAEAGQATAVKETVRNKLAEAERARSIQRSFAGNHVIVSIRSAARRAGQRSATQRP